MIKVLVVHDTLHEAKKIEHYITSYYGACSVLLCTGADKNEKCIWYPDCSEAAFKECESKDRIRIRYG